MSTTTGTETLRRTDDGGYEIRYELPAIDLRAIPEHRTSDEADAEGWAVVYGVEDSYGTTFVKRCFEAVEPLGARYPYLWMHRRDEPVGVFEVEDREEGLWIRVWFDDTQAGRDARARARSGSAPGCSVGFIWYPTVEQQAGEEDPNLILAARLIETSQITLGMQSVPGSEIKQVRSAFVEEGRGEADEPEDVEEEEERGEDPSVLIWRLATA